MKKSKFFMIGMVSSLVIIGGIYFLMEENKKSTINETVEMTADYPKYDNATTLVDSSDLIFSGKVINVDYQMIGARIEPEKDSVTGLADSPDLPYTIYKIKIDKVYKGQITSDTIEVKRLGGKIDSTEYVLDEMSTIKKDGSYVFLAESFENNYPSLMNSTQASYDLSEASNYKETFDNPIKLESIMEILK